MAALGPGSHIVVVGGGVAGITSALLLQQRYKVTLLEARPRLGGHANPVQIQGRAGPIKVDTGFLIYNLKTYTDFLTLLDVLGVADKTMVADMSFSQVSEDGKIAFSDVSRLALLDGGRNIFRPRVHRIALQLRRLRQEAHDDLHNNVMDDITLGQYLQSYSPEFREHMLYPLASAIWSLPKEEVVNYPAVSFFQFFLNHGLLKGDTGKQWRTLRGSSAVYMDAFCRQFTGEIRLGCPVDKVKRTSKCTHIYLRDGNKLDCDGVVMATHADDALGLLSEASPEESSLLGPWRYHKTQALLHKDTSLMPKRRHLWASWNVMPSSGDTVVSYHLNRVQSLDCDEQIFLSLTERSVPDELLIARLRYKHPIFDGHSVATQSLLPSLNGPLNTWYCGSYFGFGFHQDAVASALVACRNLGVDWPRIKSSTLREAAS